MSMSRMRIAVTADTRNFDAAMRHVRGQAAQARRAVAPTMGAMGMGGMGRMAGMGLGMAGMAGPFAAMAAATAAVAAAVNAIKERRESQDSSLKEIIASGMSPQQQAQFSTMAQMISEGGKAADVQGLIDTFAKMGDQQKLDLESVIGSGYMADLAKAGPQQMMSMLAFLQRQHGSAFTDQLSDKDAAMVRSLSRLKGSDIERAFGQEADLGDAVLREQRRVEDVGSNVFERFVRFLKRSFEDAQATNPITRASERDRELKELERLGKVPV